MNQAALLDGVLAGVAWWLALATVRRYPALFLGSVLLAGAATLGALRFSGLLALPQLHQYLSLLGAGAGLPLVAVAVVAPGSAVASQTRYAWIFGGVACVLCTVVGVVLQFKAFSAATALASALAILLVSARRKQFGLAAAGLAMLAALVLFALKAPVPRLAPGDVLHGGLAMSLWLILRHQGRDRPPQAPIH